MLRRISPNITYITHERAGGMSERNGGSMLPEKPGRKSFRVMSSGDGGPNHSEIAEIGLC